MSILFPGTSHPGLAELISKKYKLKLGRCEIKKFACQEIYVKLNEDVRGLRCFILQTATQRVNDELMEVCLLSDALRRQKPKEIVLIMPHFGYARQDRLAEAGEPISAKVAADLLVCAGISHIITFDLHSDQIEGFFDVPVDNIKCYGLFADYFNKKELQDPVVVAPDSGAAKIAQRLANLLNCQIAILHKTRPGHHQVEHTHLIGDVKGKAAILFDDMIDTASTVCTAAEELLNQGATQVFIAATHGIFSGPAPERLASVKCEEIIVTDTLPINKSQFSNLKILSIAELLENIL
ncbi:MAG: ribose-phosphate pyrophosphokinase, partial [Patescibacteria group bacterium]